MRLVRLSLLAALAAAGIAPRALRAQLSIRPLVVMMNDASRVADFNVKNDSDLAQEVTIDLRFGYLKTDSLGAAYMEYSDTTAARVNGMMGWTTAFPRRFVLQPGSEQVVRLGARPPAALPTGVYWTRLVTGSQPLSKPAEVATTEVSSTIIVRLVQVTTVMFKHGDITNAVAAGTLSARVDSGEIQLLMPLTRTGASPFIGQSRVTVRDARGKIVHESRSPLAVYFDLVHRMILPRAALAQGSYTADVRIDNEVSDVPVGALPKVPPVTVRVDFTVK